MTISAAEYQAITRHDFYTFINRSFLELNPQVSFLHNWHIELIAAELELCRHGATRRLIINVPPRSLKSHCATVAFPAFLLGHNPSAQIICVSYGQDLANKHAMDCRTLLASAWYQHLFPTRLSSTRQALQELSTTINGSRLATSVGGVLTGRGALIRRSESGTGGTRLDTALMRNGSRRHREVAPRMLAVRSGRGYQTPSAAGCWLGLTERPTRRDSSGRG
jgi:hypothetical protein